jgi:hypothetical protein
MPSSLRAGPALSQPTLPPPPSPGQPAVPAVLPEQHGCKRKGEQPCTSWLIVGVLPEERRYFLSAIFGALFVALSDPGGKHGPRVARMTVMAVAGGLLTALGFGIGGGPGDGWC